MSDLFFGKFGISAVCYIVARHLEVGGTHVIKTFLPRKTLCHRAADTGITAARKYKIDVLISH